MSRASALLCAALALACAGAAPPDDAWRSFEGTWSASGRKDVVPTEGDRPAAIVHLSGALVLTRGDGLGGGFRGEVIGFDDGGTVRVGRMVWTDDRGDRIFSALEGEPLETGRRIVGRITGGTGRYAGATGSFEFTWQYVVPVEEGEISGRAVSLRGHIRLPPRAP